MGGEGADLGDVLERVRGPRGGPRRRALERGHGVYRLLSFALQLGVEGQHRGVQPQVFRVERSNECFEFLAARTEARVESKMVLVTCNS